jgi:hypothetical protein
MDGWMDGWMGRLMVKNQRNMLDVLYYIYVAFFGTIINILYPSITPQYIADTPISHFNK